MEYTLDQHSAKRKDLSRACIVIGTVLLALPLFCGHQYISMVSALTWMEMYGERDLPSLDTIWLTYGLLSILPPIGLTGLFYGCSLLDPHKTAWSPLRLLSRPHLTALAGALWGSCFVMLTLAQRAVSVIVKGLAAYRMDTDTYLLPSWVSGASKVCIFAWTLFTLLLLLDLRKASIPLPGIKLERGAALEGDPSYRLLFLKKGTWMQLFGWIWILGGFLPFYRFADLCFPMPDTMYVDYFKAPIVADMSIRQHTLVNLLQLLGLFTVCYGFSLNRKAKEQQRLFFRQFSGCQLLFLASSLCYSIGSPLFVTDLLYDLGRYESPLTPVRNAAFLAWLVLLPLTALVWLVLRVRRFFRGRKNAP